MDKYSVNSVMLVGRLGKDPEMREASVSIANFSLATTYSKKEDGEYVDKTEWHRCVAFGKTAEFASRLNKGDMVCAQGQIRTREWVDKSDVKRYITEIFVNTITTLARGTAKADDAQDSNDSELPF